LNAELEDIAAVYEERVVEFLCVATAIVSDGDRARDAVQDASADAIIGGRPGSRQSFMRVPAA
jgi:hypothetical protein